MESTNTLQEFLPRPLTPSIDNDVDNYNEIGHH